MHIRFESGNVCQSQHRDIEGIAEAHETRRLSGSLCGQLRFIGFHLFSLLVVNFGSVRHCANSLSVQLQKSGDHLSRVSRLGLHKYMVVSDCGKHNPGIAGGVLQSAAETVQIIRTVFVRSVVFIICRQHADQLPDTGENFLLGPGKVHQSRFLALEFRRCSVTFCSIVAFQGIRRIYKQLCLFLLHKRKIRQRRHKGQPTAACSENGSNLRNNAGRHALL